MTNYGMRPSGDGLPGEDARIHEDVLGEEDLEWTSSPAEAMDIAIYLTIIRAGRKGPQRIYGIAWSIGGVHDRAWKERPIFGKVRYMSYNGAKTKFDIKAYIEKINSF